jgi:hypothetical protein
MTDTLKETDKEVLKRILNHPTFEEVREAARREHEKYKEPLFKGPGGRPEGPQRPDGTYDPDG